MASLSPNKKRRHNTRRSTLSCSKCNDTIPPDGKHVQLAPCGCELCMDCLLTAHIQRGSSLLRCCNDKQVVASHQVLVAGLVEGDIVRYKVEEEVVKEPDDDDDTMKKNSTSTTETSKMPHIPPPTAAAAASVYQTTTTNNNKNLTSEIRERFNLLATLSIPVLKEPSPNSRIDIGNIVRQNLLRQLTEYMDTVKQPIQCESINSAYQYNFLKVTTPSKDRSNPDIREGMNTLFEIGEEEKVIQSLINYLLKHHGETFWKSLRENKRFRREEKTLIAKKIEDSVPAMPADELPEGWTKRKIPRSNPKPGTRQADNCWYSPELNVKFRHLHAAKAFAEKVADLGEGEAAALQQSKKGSVHETEVTMDEAKNETTVETEDRPWLCEK